MNDRQSWQDPQPFPQRPDFYPSPIYQPDEQSPGYQTQEGANRRDPDPQKAIDMHRFWAAIPIDKLSLELGPHNPSLSAGAFYSSDTGRIADQIACNAPSFRSTRPYLRPQSCEGSTSHTRRKGTPIPSESTQIGFSAAKIYCSQKRVSYLECPLHN